MLARGTLLALHRWCWLRPASTAIHTSASATAPVSSSDSADHKDGHVEQKLKAKNRWYHLGWRYDKLLKKTNLFQADDLRQFVASALSIGTYAGAGAAGLGTLGVDMTPFTAAVSVTGLTLGFAARDIASQYISGLLLLVTEPFGRGDHVILGPESHNIRGIVKQMDMRYLYLVPRDGGQILMVPNSTVFTSVLQVSVTDQHRKLSGGSDSDAVIGPSQLQILENQASEELQVLINKAWAETDSLFETLGPLKHPQVHGLASVNLRKVALWLAHDPQRFESPEWQAFLASTEDASSWLPRSIARLHEIEST